MKKFLKISAIISIAGMFLFISAIMGIYLFVDPNDYKDKIAGEVQKATGRSFSIQGDIALSVFPVLELKVGAMELKNPPDFEEKIMARIEDAELGLKLLPLLLRKELEMKKIILSGLDIRLIKNQDGKTNWDDLAERFSSKEDKPDSENSENMLDKLDIAGVKLNNLRAVFEDKQQGVSYQISNLNLDSGKLKIGKPLDIDLKFNLASAKPKINANFDLKTVINLLLNEQLVRLDKTQFAIALNEYLPDNQDKSLSGNLNLSSDMTVNWGSSDFKAENLNLKTDAKGIQQLPNGEADADLKASLLSLNWKKPAFEITGLELSDNKNNHKIQGNVSILDIQQNPKIRFDLTGDEIDINRYLSASSDKQAEKEETQRKESIFIQES